MSGQGHETSCVEKEDFSVPFSNNENTTGDVMERRELDAETPFKKRKTGITTSFMYQSSSYIESFYLLFLYII